MYHTSSRSAFAFFLAWEHGREGTCYGTTGTGRLYSFIHSLDFYIFKKISLFTAPICWDGCGCGQFYETMSESLYDIVGILFMHDMVIYAMYGMIYSPSRSDQVQEVVVWEGSHDVFFFLQCDTVCKCGSNSEVK